MSDKIVIDKGDANAARIHKINKILKRFDGQAEVQTIRAKCAKKIVEQGHRFIKRHVRHMCGFNSFESASVTLGGASKPPT
ncbi:DDE-type integrase/transposase/recombinase [uncultured Ruegeria sp.]|uniref:DDE-type integrase/transposase/recombinase n=1 Tax=uncultured Ruegeria sp. TaxID=259304 RepID=UPI002609B48E|nr:DDE-type integrase/transposase/recombinase [uncultured Ruegeria sp.]